ncbi:MAG: response regulator [Candidatus Thermoplasmatota archaeon]
MATVVRVLIVDDSAESRASLRAALGPDFLVEEASTAALAFERSLEERFDVVLCDFVLPDEDGVTLTKRFADATRHTPVVGISTSDSADIAYAFLRAGATDFLCKKNLLPLRLLHSVRSAVEARDAYVRLRETRHRVLGGLSTGAGAGTNSNEDQVGPAPRAPPGASVLVVDDAEDLRFLLRRTLQNVGWRVMTAGTAQEALRMASETKPDVILVDYLLPDEDGLTLLRHLRERGVTSPIIALTAHGNEHVAEAFLRAGAADFLSKGTELWTRLPFVMATAMARSAVHVDVA